MLTLLAKTRITKLEEELGRMSPDMGAIAAFQKKDAEYNSRLSELESVTGERNQVRFPIAH